MPGENTEKTEITEQPKAFKSYLRISVCSVISVFSVFSPSLDSIAETDHDSRRDQILPLPARRAARRRRNRKTERGNRQIQYLMSTADKAASLSAELCRARAKECLNLAQQVTSQSHSIMLGHIAETWYRIADSLRANDA